MSIGMHPTQLKLLHSYVGDLRDGPTVSEALRGVTGQTMITVIKQAQPCRVQPECYGSYVKRDVVAALEVDRIRLGFGHPVDFIEEREERRLFGLWGRAKRGRKGEVIGVPRLIPAEPVDFPPPNDIDINMMPFIMGQRSSIPAAYQQYWPLIERCKLPYHELGRVGYLTIQESLVPAGQSQRRSSLHIESPGTIKRGGKYNKQRTDWGCGMVRFDTSEVDGGIYMASSVPDSCRFWNVQVDELVVGDLGDLEHLRDVLGPGTCMEPGILYWLTDTTPHESLPLPRETYRQYFRLVTSSLTAWYPEHSTANSLGIIPNPAITQTIDGSKFA